MSNITKTLLARDGSLLRKPVGRNIAVLDDLFPNAVSGFRFEEFSFYLDVVPEVSIYCDGGSLKLVGDVRPIEVVLAEHLAAHPHHVGRIHLLSSTLFPEADAYYTIFLNNIARYLDAIERTGKPFAFTLYPGGGFQVGQKRSDHHLDRVCNNQALKYIIVTQPYTRDYILRNFAQSEKKIRYLPGGVVPRLAFSTPSPRKYFGIDNDTLAIGFVANRYTPHGKDKGYDLFVETARELCRCGVDAVYHVVGPWGPDIVPLEGLTGRFVFHGFVTTEKLRELGRVFDLVLSPNRPGVLLEGAFDGFPTGSCVEIGLQEAAIFCTDILRQNTAFRDGIDLVIIEPSVENIVRRLLAIIGERGGLARVGKNGRIRLREVFGSAKQLAPRLAILRELIFR